MQAIKHVPETTFTLEIADLRFSITHQSAYCLMLFCLGESLVPGKENLFELPFTSPVMRKPKAPAYIKEFKAFHGCLLYTARSSDSLRIVLDNNVEYEISRSTLLWFLYDKLKTSYGVYVNIPVTGDQAERRSYYDSLVETTGYLYPMKDDETHLSIDYCNKKYYLYLLSTEGYCTRPVWVDNNDVSRPLQKYEFLNLSGVYLDSKYNGDHSVVFSPRTGWLTNQEKKDNSTLKLFSESVIDAVLAF